MVFLILIDCYTEKIRIGDRNLSHFVDKEFYQFFERLSLSFFEPHSIIKRDILLLQEMYSPDSNPMIINEGEQNLSSEEAIERSFLSAIMTDNDDLKDKRAVDALNDAVQSAGLDPNIAQQIADFLTAGHDHTLTFQNLFNCQQNIHLAKAMGFVDIQNLSEFIAQNGEGESKKRTLDLNIPNILKNFVANPSITQVEFQNARQRLMQTYMKKVQEKATKSLFLHRPETPKTSQEERSKIERLKEIQMNTIENVKFCLGQNVKTKSLAKVAAEISKGKIPEKRHFKETDLNKLVKKSQTETSPYNLIENKENLIFAFNCNRCPVSAEPTPSDQDLKESPYEFASQEIAGLNYFRLKPMDSLEEAIKHHLDFHVDPKKKSTQHNKIIQCRFCPEDSPHLFSCCYECHLNHMEILHWSSDPTQNQGGCPFFRFRKSMEIKYAYDTQKREELKNFFDVRCNFCGHLHSSNKDMLKHSKSVCFARYALTECLYNGEPLL